MMLELWEVSTKVWVDAWFWISQSFCISEDMTGWYTLALLHLFLSDINYYNDLKCNMLDLKNKVDVLEEWPCFKTEIYYHFRNIVTLSHLVFCLVDFVGFCFCTRVVFLKYIINIYTLDTVCGIYLDFKVFDNGFKLFKCL